MAGVDRRAAFLMATAPSTIVDSWNVDSVTRTAVGTYVIVLSTSGPVARGIVTVNASRGDGAGWGEFTAANEITVTFRSAASNALTDLPNGTKVQLVAYWAAG